MIMELKKAGKWWTTEVQHGAYTIEIRSGKEHGMKAAAILHDRNGEKVVMKTRHYGFIKPQELIEKMKYLIDREDRMHVAWLWCDENDKSTEFMLEYMKDASGDLDYDAIISFLKRMNDKKRGAWLYNYSKLEEQV